MQVWIKSPLLTSSACILNQLLTLLTLGPRFACSANEVMTLVRGFADRGTSVCATIHSPSAATFKLFHSVMVLLRGGVVYFGPAGAPALTFARNFWPSKDKGLGLEELTDAEALVSLITEADRRGESQALADIYSSSSLKKVSEIYLLSWCRLCEMHLGNERREYLQVLGMSLLDSKGLIFCLPLHPNFCRIMILTWIT